MVKKELQCELLQPSVMNPLLIHKSRSLVVRPHEDMQANCLGMTVLRWERDESLEVGMSHRMDICGWAAGDLRLLIRLGILRRQKVARSNKPVLGWGVYSDC